MRQVGLLNDILFRIVFGTQQNEQILRALVNALLGLTGDQKVVDLTILNPAKLKEFATEKGIILDIKARDISGVQLNIELQLQNDDDYINRSIYYVSQLFCEQLDKGQEYCTLAKTIGISIADFTLFKDHKNVHSKFVFYDPEQELPLNPNAIELHYIELRKFLLKEPTDTQTRFEKWLYVLKFSDLYQPEGTPIPENLAEEEGISMAIDAMRKAYAIDEVRERIKAQQKSERDERSRLKNAEARGETKGEAKGRLKGKLEGKLELAGELLKDGLDLEKVARLSGISVEELITRFRT